MELHTTDEQIWSSRRPTGEWGGPLGMLERNESDISVHPVIPTADRLTVGTPLPAYAFSNPRFFAGTPNAYMTSVFGYLMSFELEESDISVHPVIPTADRLTVGTPLPAYAFSNPRFFAGTPNAYMTSVFGYLMSFELEVWLGLLVCWPLVSVFISIIEKVRCRARFNEIIVDNLFDILGIMMFEGELFILSPGVVFSRKELFEAQKDPFCRKVLDGLREPGGAAAAHMEAAGIAVGAERSGTAGTIRPVRDAVGRVVFAVWWLAVLVLMNSFQGTMKASMSVKTPTERLETFRDVAERPYLKPIIIRGTTFEHQFQVPEAFTTIFAAV
ncbi:hypothetical protein HPB49_009617 [Dermacentor silvarum]|uniref:Uncharacterized protein n=1 Tax=Dermacentor silvarum TaxID=543639 RepID=A0ACB8CWL7_DERSI|nr:hypothetical protein HPB49_009617 [Dermacentor silvarum]